MRKFFHEWLIPLLIAFAITITLNHFVFNLVIVPSGSMLETIQIGDRFYVNKLFNVEDAQRGDILVFESEELDKTLIKRLIGLPGEEVDIDVNGQVYIDGEVLEEPYKKESSNREMSFIVPEGEYFFLGDNRPNSRDARDWDNPFIRADDIDGKAVFRFYPFDNMSIMKKVDYNINK